MRWLIKTTPPILIQPLGDWAFVDFVCSIVLSTQIQTLYSRVSNFPTCVLCVCVCKCFFVPFSSDMPTRKKHLLRGKPWAVSVVCPRNVLHFRFRRFRRDVNVVISENPLNMHIHPRQCTVMLLVLLWFVGLVIPPTPTPTPSSSVWLLWLCLLWLHYRRNNICSSVCSKSRTHHTLFFLYSSIPVFFRNE